MRKMSVVEWVAVVLLVIGGLNWGLVGLFQYNLVTSLFGDGTLLSNLVFDLVGLAALVELYFVFMPAKE
jgi:uncharacterized membrane protein YuzA (DUF378 family)